MTNSTVGGLCVLISLILAAWPLAPLTNRFLKRKHEEMDRYWHDMLERCQQDASDKGANRWLKRQKAALGGGKLCRERALALYDAGYVTNVGDPSALKPLACEQARFSFEPTLPERLGCAALTAALPLWLTVTGSAAAVIALSVPTSLLLLHVVICDLRARIIPYQATAAYAVTGIAWVTLLDTPCIFDDAALALAAAAILVITERAALRLTGASAIGAGDRRIIPIICFQIGFGGIAPGLIALCLVAGAMAVFALARGRSRRSYLPFAPALFAMAIVGAASSAPSLTGILI